MHPSLHIETLRQDMATYLPHYIIVKKGLEFFTLLKNSNIKHISFLSRKWPPEIENGKSILYDLIRCIAFLRHVMPQLGLPKII